MVFGDQSQWLTSSFVGEILLLKKIMKMGKQFQKSAIESGVRFICPSGSVLESETQMVSRYLCNINQGPELPWDVCVQEWNKIELWKPKLISCILLTWFWKHGRKSLYREFCAEDLSSFSHFPSVVSAAWSLWIS